MVHGCVSILCDTAGTHAVSVASERVMRRRERLTKIGLCRSCGSVPRRPNRQLCARCAASERRIADRLRERLKALGVCVTCRQQPARPNRIACSQCATVSGLRAHYRYANARARAIQHYGGRCVCCGEDNEIFLQFDHIDGRGGEHRRNDIQTANNMGGWLERHGYPKGFQLLCANCNSARARYGICPHDTKGLMDDANSVH